MTPNNRLYHMYHSATPFILPPIYSDYKHNRRVYVYRHHHQRFTQYISPFCFGKIIRANVKQLGGRNCRPRMVNFTTRVTRIVHHRCNNVNFRNIATMPLREGRLQQQNFGPTRLLTGRLTRHLRIPCLPLLRGQCVAHPRGDLDTHRQDNGLLNTFSIARPATLPNHAILLISSIVAANTALSRYTGVVGVCKTRRIFTIATTYSILGVSRT